MKYTGCLFDIDGVLYDSMPLHARSWIEAFKQEGININPQLVYEAAGMPDLIAAKFIVPEITEQQAKSISTKKIELFNVYPEPKLIAGSVRLLEFLKSNGIAICLVTGSSQTSTVNRVRRDFGIEREQIILGNEVDNGKPHPEPFLKGLAKLKMGAEKVIAIEDAPLGIKSAKEAQLYCIALKTGLLSKEELMTHGANLVFNDCLELLENIDLL